MRKPDATTADQNQPGRYAIRLTGHLDDRWVAWFGGMTLTREANGETRLTGQLVDQAALHGVLRKVRDVGLPLLSVVHLGPERADGPDVHP